MRSIGKDIQFALRAFRKSPVFTGVALLSLALGIGANTAIFTLLDQVLLRLMPVKNPQQLALLSVKGMVYGSNWGDHAISYPMYQDFQANNSVFSGMFCRFGNQLTLGFNGTTERVDTDFVSGSYFSVLGVRAALGRTFTTEVDRPKVSHPEVMLSYAYWQSRFAGDPSIVGKTMVVSGHNYTVIGVVQKGFDGVELGSESKVFAPLMSIPELLPLLADQLDYTNRRNRWVNAFGRLKPGVSRQQALASLQPYYHSLLEMEVKEAAFNKAPNEVREKFLKNSIEVLSGAQGLSRVRGTLETPLWVLMALTGGVLLIACANVASLLIARAASRQKEIAIRIAIGAGRGRIIRQLLVESLLLSAAGGILGLVFALWTDRALLALLPPETISLEISALPDLRVLLFATAVSLLTGVIFGMAPALQSANPNVAPTLKDTTGGVVGAGTHVRVRKALVAVQVMLSLLLLVGAGLFIRSLRNLRELGPGFATENLVAFEVNPSLNGYSSERSKLFFRQITADLQAIPGVRSVGIAAVRILADNDWDSSVAVEGYRSSPTDSPQAFMNMIGPGYFATLATPIVAGRNFTERDTETVQHDEKAEDLVPRHVIVNEKFAKRFFGSVPKAVGRHVGFGTDNGTHLDMEIVGVVKDIKYTNLRDDVPIQMFLPYLATKVMTGMTIYVRTALAPDQFFSVVRSKVRGLDANLPLYGARTMEEQVSNSLLVQRLTASLSAVFGFLATLLAVIGLYGVMAYTVARRTREIGIRVALGAFQGDVIWMVMREVFWLVGIGLAAGLVASIALSRLVQAQLYGITGQDPLTIALAGLLLAAVACAAGYIPALRASRIDAMRALHYE
jgi:predicted permease